MTSAEQVVCKEEYYNITKTTLNSLNYYIHHRIRPGGFLYAVLTNNLFEAFMRADEDNYNNMGNIVKYIHNNVRLDCYGSVEKVERWLEGKT